MNGKERKRLMSLARHLDVTLHVGKAGLSDDLLAEADRQLKDHELVKVRLLRSSRVEDGRKAVAEKLAGEVNADVVDVRGFTAVLYRPKNRPSSAGS